MRLFFGREPVNINHATFVARLDALEKRRFDRTVKNRLVQVFGMVKRTETPRFAGLYVGAFDHRTITGGIAHKKGLVRRPKYAEFAACGGICRPLYSSRANA